MKARKTAWKRSEFSVMRLAFCASLICIDAHKKQKSKRLLFFRNFNL